MKKQLLINICLVIVMLLLVACNTTGKPIVPNQGTVDTLTNGATLLDPTTVNSAEFVSNEIIAAENGISDNDVISIIVDLGGESLYERYLNSGVSGSISAFAASAEGIATLNNIENIQNEFDDLARSFGIVMQYKYRYNVLSTAVCVSTAYRNVKTLENIEGVKSVAFDTQYATPDVTVSVSDLISETGVTENTTGYDGTGRVISIIDTGLDWKHEAFQVMPEVSQIKLADVESLVNLFSFNSKGIYKAEQLYINEKVGFGFDYADNDTNIIPSELGVLQASCYHGTHVAGTAAGNAASGFKGVAYNAQLVIMKVFGDGGNGGYQSDIVAAASDAMLLGADTINMSLGSPMGYSVETSASTALVSELYELIDRAGVSIVASAGNSYNTGLGSQTSANYTSNPDIGTIGAPGSYLTSWAVASMGTQLDYYARTGDGLKLDIANAADANSYYMDFYGDFFAKNAGGVYDYVMVPGIGEANDYNGVDVEGKIALVSRGQTTFAEKVLQAEAHGAIACLLYNNQAGTIVPMIDKAVGIAVGVLTQEQAQTLAAATTKTLAISKDIGDGPFMSNFSSWGVLSDLTIKPEITGFGGDIYAPVPETYGKGLYTTMSGTSMSSPNVAGIATVVRQYLKERYPEYTNKQIQDLAYQLIMSTATNALDENGNPAFVRKQGAGIANIDNAVNTKAYLSVTGSNRTKIELGDDPSESGIYTLKFNLVNISEEALTYDIGTLTFTESVAANGYNVAYLAHMFTESNVAITANNATLDGTKITVEANQTAAIKVKITLTEDEKNYIRDNFENGYYVEGYVQLHSENADEIDLQICWLAFFGDFTKAPVFENSIYDEDTTMHFGNVAPLLSYGEDQAVYAGMFPYNLPEGYEEVPTTDKNAALSFYTTTTNGLYSIRLYTLRSIRKLEYILTDDISGEVLYNAYADDVRKTYYNTNTGSIIATSHALNINAYSFNFSNNQVLRMTVRATLDFYRPTTQEFSFLMKVDFETPEYLDATLSTEDGRYYVAVDMYDNYKLMSYQLYTVNGSALGNRLHGNYAFPVYEWNEGLTNVVKFDVTDYLDTIEESGDNRLGFYVQDWAFNPAAWAIDVTELIDAKNAAEEGGEEGGEGEEGQANVNVAGKIESEEDGHVVVTSENGDFVVVDGVLTAYNGTDSEVIIPDDLGIVKCDAGVFRYKAVTKVVFPEGMKILGRQQFYGNGYIEEVILPSTLEELGDYVFQGTKALKEITIPGSVRSYSYCNFMYSGVEKVIFEEGAKFSDFGSFGFYQCYNLKEIQLPEITSFGYGCFRQCTSLTNITVPASVTSFGSSQVFYACYELRSITYLGTQPAALSNSNDMTRCHNDLHIYVPAESVDSYKASWTAYADKIHSIGEFDIDENGTLNGYNGTETNVIIPSGVKSIKEGAFEGNENITAVFMPYTITTIGENAFRGAKNLKSAIISFNVTTLAAGLFEGSGLESITIPAKVDTINDRAFYNCTSLKTINVLNRTPAKLGTDVFGNLPEDATIVLPEKTTQTYKDDASWSALVNYFEEINPWTIVDGVLEGYGGIGGDLVIPTGVTEIAANALASNNKIITLVVPDTVTKIGDDAFSGCTNLVKAVIPDSVVEVGDGLFDGCVRLTDVTWPSKITVIPTCTFQNCGSLKEFDFEGITEVQSYGFFGCGFERLILPESLTLYSIYSFASCGKIEYCEVWGDVNSDWCQFGMKWDSLKTLKVYGDFNGEMNGYDFAVSTLLEEVYFYGYVNSISNWCFTDCYSLKKVEFFGDVNSIGGSSFNNCPELSEMIFHGNFGGLDYSRETYEGMYPAAVARTDKLTQFTVSEDNEYLVIDEYGVLYNKDMTYVYAQPSAWDYDGVYVMPDTVTYVPNHAFVGPQYATINFEYVKNGGWTASLGPNHQPKTGLKGVKLSKNLEYIGAQAFIGDYTYTDQQRFDENHETYRMDVTRGFVNLESIEFGVNENGAALEIAMAAFAYHDTIDFDMPNNLVVLGQSAFANCGIVDLVLPEGFESLEQFSFTDNKELVSVTIPSTMLPDNFGAAFIGCEKLSKYIINNNPYFVLENEFILDSTRKIAYSYIGDEASVVVPEGVVFISPNAFLNNEDLVKVTLPSTLKAIGDKAFKGCANLKEVVFLSEKAPLLYAKYNETWVNYGTFYMYENFVKSIYYAEYADLYAPKDKLLLTMYYLGDESYRSYLYATYFRTAYVIDENGNVIGGEEEEGENEANSVAENNAAMQATVFDASAMRTVTFTIDNVDAIGGRTVETEVRNNSVNFVGDALRF